MLRGGMLRHRKARRRLSREQQLAIVRDYGFHGLPATRLPRPVRTPVLRRVV